VFIENDASIVGLGEAVSGAGMGEEIVVYITVSTGVGGTRIVSGEIDEHAYGFEPGHELINMQDSLEDLVSGTAVEERLIKSRMRFHKKIPCGMSSQRSSLLVYIT